MIPVQIGKKKCNLPESFADIKPALLFKLAPFIYKSKPDRILALSLLTQVGIDKLNRISESDLYMLINIISFLFKPSSQKPIQSFKIYNSAFLLPESEFTDLCLIEMAMADVFFNLFITTSDTAHLDRLIAEICRPAKSKEEIENVNWDGSFRQTYNGKFAEQNATLFKSLSEEIKVCILNYYVGSSIAFRNRYHEVYETPNETKEETKTTYNWKENSHLLLINNLSKTGQYGDYEKTCTQNVHVVFLNLVQDKLNNKVHTPLPIWEG